MKNNFIALYLLMLLAHIAHVFEEVWARFWLVDVFGLGAYLVINWGLFCVPVFILYFVLQEKSWAYRLAMVYATVMVLNGISHNVATLVTGRYFDGFAGGFTGVALAILGVLMLHSLRQAKE